MYAAMGGNSGLSLKTNSISLLALLPISMWISALVRLKWVWALAIKPAGARAMAEKPFARLSSTCLHSLTLYGFMQKQPWQICQRVRHLSKPVLTKLGKFLTREVLEIPGYSWKFGSI